MTTSERGRCAGNAPRLRLVTSLRRRLSGGSAAPLGGIAFGGTLLRILKDEMQLIEVELFRTRAVAMAQQPLDQLPQLLVLGLQFRHHLLQHALQNSRIVRQCREIDLHNTMMMT